MKNAYRYAGVLILTVIAYVFYAEHNRSVERPLKFDIPTIFSTKEDPAARAMYEFNKVKSPRTKTIPKNIRAKELQFAKTLPDAESLRGHVLHKAAVFNWQNRGPFNVGGRTRALGLDVSDPSGNTILAGGVSGAMWKSTNKGTSWRQTTDPLALPSISAIVQDARPGKTNTWYYGTGEFRSSTGNISGVNLRGDGIYRSDDNGETWTLLASTATNRPHQFDQDFDYIWNIVVDNSNTIEDEVYAAVYGGIYKSLDKGNTWSLVLGTTSSQSPYTDVVIDAQGVLYASLSSESEKRGIWRSEDGDTWINITPSGWPSNYRRTVIANAPSDSSIVYFLTEPTAGNNEIWKYRYVAGDGSGSGGFWEDRSSNLPNDPQNPVTKSYNSQSSYNMVIKVYPEDANIVFIGGTNLYRSMDGFASTAQVKHVGGYSTAATDQNAPIWDNHHPDQHALVFSHVDPKVLFSAHDGGVTVTNNPLATALSSFIFWKDLNNGYLTTQFYTVAIDQEPNASSDKIIIGGMQDNSTYLTESDDPGDDWENIFSGDGGYAAIQGNGSHTISSAQRGFFARQTRDGSAGTIITPSQPSVNDFLFITPLIIDRNNENLVYIVAGTKVYRYNDISDIPLDGNTSTKSGWERLNPSNANNAQITAIAVSKTPANILYIGTSTGEVVRIDDAHIGTTPTGTNTTFNKGLPAGEEAYISSIAVDPNDGNAVLVSFSNYEQRSLFFTSDGGTTWSHVSGNLEENPTTGAGNGPSTRAVGILKWDGTNIYFTGTSTGLYSTTLLDAENTIWVQEGPTTIGNVLIDMIATREVDGEVVIATHGAGVFSRDFVTDVDDDDVLVVPSTINLHQNYPNPFNPSTTIRFELTKPERVTLTVFNTLGQTVRRLRSDELFNSGANSIVFDGKDELGRQLASGVYFYRLTAGQFVETRKMMLIK